MFVDPARAPVWERYAGATLLTPNRAELEIAWGGRVTDAELETAGLELMRRYRLDGLLVTLGRDGALLLRQDHPAQRFPTTPRAVYDNTGAGDAVLAMFAVAVAAGATFEQATMLANVAGGLEVSKFGCVPITQAEVHDELTHGAGRGRGKLRSVVELKGELDARRQRGETIVFTNGCFDSLHPGHVELLEKAKALGSVLVVGLNSDASVRAQGKGDGRPFRTQADRARMLAGWNRLIMSSSSGARPGAHRRGRVPRRARERRGLDRQRVGQEFVESRGGRVVLVQLVEGYNTTREMQRIAGCLNGKTQETR